MQRAIVLTGISLWLAVATGARPGARRVRAHAEESRQSSAADSTEITPVLPGDSSLRENRVADYVDTISLLVTRRDSAERLYAVLVRRLAHVDYGGVAVLRETQQYRFADGRISDDTLEVLQSTLAPVRYFSASGGVAFDVHLDGKRTEGWSVNATGMKSLVHADAGEPFFVSIMTEAFVAAFPLTGKAVVRIPVANPPSPEVHATVLRVTASDTIKTAHGAIDCRVVTGPGNTQTWIARDDGRLIRMRWSLPNGTTVWKLPSRDVDYR